jgi:hypothetical protein
MILLYLCSYVRCDQLKNKSSRRVTYGNPCYSIGKQTGKANSIYFLNDRSVQYSKEAFFPPGNNSDSVFSSFLPRFSSFYKMEIVTFRTSHKLFTIYSDFFQFFLKLSTLKLSNRSASNGILLPLSTACLQFDYFCLN